MLGNLLDPAQASADEYPYALETAPSTQISMLNEKLVASGDMLRLVLQYMSFEEMFF